jgi:hypothetical protein
MSAPERPEITTVDPCRYRSAFWRQLAALLLILGFVVSGATEVLANGESEGRETGRSEERKDAAHDDNDDEDDDRDDRQEAPQVAASNAASVGTGATPHLADARQSFLDEARKWTDATGKIGGDYGDFLRRAADLAESERFRHPDSRRIRVGRLDGTLAQHMTDLFAAEAGLGRDADAAVRNFSGKYTHSTVKEFDSYLDERLKTFTTRLSDVNNRIESGLDGLSDNDRAGIMETQANLTHAINHTIPRLKDEIALYRSLKDASFGDGAVKRSKDSYVRASQAVFRLHAGNVHNEQTRIRSNAVRLSELKRLGGAIGEVHRLDVDWASGTVARPSDGAEGNAGFKPDAINDLEMNLTKTGVATGASMRLGARQVAFKRIADRLGYGHLVPETQLAQINGKYGVLQEWVAGEPPLGYARRTLDPAKVPENQREIERLKISELREARAWAGKFVADRAAAKNESETWARGELQRLRSDIDTQRARFEDDGTITVKVGEDYRSDTAESLVNDERFARDLAIAEILDRLTGQVDRHSFNILLTPNGEVKLIDNDQGFGHEDDATGVPYGAQAEFPQYLDSQLANRLLGLEESDMRTATAGLLTSMEQDALIMRLLSLQAKAREMLDSGNVIHLNPPNESAKSWRTDGVAHFRGQPESYFGRIVSKPSKAEEQARRRGNN